ncbi:MAG: glycosyltransferase family 61 protein [Pseudonocardiaceae bacterium]
MTRELLPQHDTVSSIDLRAVGRTATAADWVTATGQGHVHTLAPPTLVNRPRLDHADIGASASARKVQRFVAPAAQVVELPHAQVWGPDGTVLTADGCVVEDLIRAWGQATEDHPVWAAPSLPPHEVRGTAAVIAARGAATNFSHFLADTLPRIQLVRDTGIEIDTWIVSSRDRRWQRDGLDLAGIPADRTIALTDIPWISARTLVVPSRTGFAPTTAPWARDRLTNLLQPGTRPREHRILISRQRAPRRRLHNEDDVLDRLARHGFERVDFDTIPLAEQIRTIHESRTIVAVHGAALGHLLHAPRTGRVVEIANPNVIHPDYWGLAALAN